MKAGDGSQAGRAGMLPVIVFYVGCAFILLGLISGANYLFDLELAIRRHVLPADWRIALLGVLGGACVAVWGRVLGSRAYRDAVAGHGWIPWVVWPVLSIVGLFAIFLAVQ